MGKMAGVMGKKVKMAGVSRTRDLIHLIDIRIAEILSAPMRAETSEAIRLYCDARGLLIEQISRGGSVWGDDTPAFAWASEDVIDGQ